MSGRSSASAASADTEWCYDAVQDVSRTFAITVESLEEPMASRICVGYLLCRVADTIEDAGHVPPATQADLLERYRAVLAADDDTTAEEFRQEVEPWLPEQRSPDWEVVANAPRIVATFEALDAEDREALRAPVRELVGGMAEFVERYAEAGGLRIRTIEELEEYCWYAAGTVGDLITSLLVRSADPEQAQVMRDTSRSFALLLQLVNVAKDVNDDYTEENNVYLPAEWLDDVGVDQERVCEPENADGVTRVIERVTDRASGYLDDAQAYLEAMPRTRGNTLAAWGMPYLLAVGTLRELRKRPEDVLAEGDVKVSRSEVFALLARFEQGVEPEELGELRTRIAERPFHHA